MVNNYKVLLLGDGGVGKSTLIQRYVTGFFPQATKVTMGVDFYNKALHVGGQYINLQVWDLGGEDRFQSILPVHCGGARAGIFVYSVTQLDSLLHAGAWLEVVRNQANNIPVIMVGAKTDLVSERVVQLSDAIATGQQHGIATHLEVSSKTGDNVERVFETVTQLIFEGKTQPEYAVENL